MNPSKRHALSARSLARLVRCVENEHWSMELVAELLQGAHQRAAFYNRSLDWGLDRALERHFAADNTSHRSSWPCLPA